MIIIESAYLRFMLPLPVVLNFVLYASLCLRITRNENDKIHNDSGKKRSGICIVESRKLSEASKCNRQNYRGEREREKWGMRRRKKGIG